MKKTEWFPAEVSPTIAGVYERLYPSGNARLCKWDGHEWFCFGETVEDALKVRESVGNLLKISWRGLAEAPHDN